MSAFGGRPDMPFRATDRLGNADAAIAIPEARTNIRFVFTDIDMPEQWTA
jgi:hypothetical protein